MTRSTAGTNISVGSAVALAVVAVFLVGMLLFLAVLMVQPLLARYRKHERD